MHEKDKIEYAATLIAELRNGIRSNRNKGMLLRPADSLRLYWLCFSSFPPLFCVFCIIVFSLPAQDIYVLDPTSSRVTFPKMRPVR